MTRVETYPTGVPCWVAVVGPDATATSEFYAALFGWECKNIKQPGEPPFYVASLGGDRVAGIAGPDDPGVWVTAVSVDDCDAAARAAVEAGGSAPDRTIEIPTVGRFHRLQDPAGAEIHAIEPLGGRAAGRVSEPGAWAMSLLRVPDPVAVEPFYASVFGWETEAFGPVTLFRLPGYVGGVEGQPVPRDVVAAMVQSAGAEEAAWMPDFWMADVDGAAQTVRAHGGQVLSGPEDTGTGFRSALIADRGGARLSLSQLLPGAH